MARFEDNCRLFCLVPEADTARAVVKDLSQANAGPEDVRVVARRETAIFGLQEASIRERTAIVEAAKRGLAIGSIGGAITGLVAAIELSVTLSFACGLVVVGSLAGSAFGAWVSAMMGIDRPHPVISAYQDAVDAGQVLMIIQDHREQLEQIKRLIRQQYPGAEISRISEGSTAS